MPEAPRGTAGVLTHPVRHTCETYRQALRVRDLFRHYRLPCESQTLCASRSALSQQLKRANVSPEHTAIIFALQERNERIKRTHRCRVKRIGANTTAQGLYQRMTKGPLPERGKVVQAALIALLQLASDAEVSVSDVVSDIFQKAAALDSPEQPSGLECINSPEVVRPPASTGT